MESILTGADKDKYIESRNRHVLQLKDLIEIKLKSKGITAPHKHIISPCELIKDSIMITKENMADKRCNRDALKASLLQRFRKGEKDKQTRVFCPLILPKYEHSDETGADVPEHAGPSTKESSNKQLLPKNPILANKYKIFIISSQNDANNDKLDEIIEEIYNKYFDPKENSDFIFVGKSNVNDNANKESETLESKYVMKVISAVKGNKNMLSLDISKSIPLLGLDYIFHINQRLKDIDCDKKESSNFKDCISISKYDAIDVADTVKLKNDTNVKKVHFSITGDELQDGEIEVNNSDKSIQEPNESFKSPDVPYLMKFINSQELKCKICRLSVENNAHSVKNHIESENHIMKYKEFFTKNYIRGFGTDRIFCMLCKINIMTPCEILHTKNVMHKERLHSMKLRMKNNKSNPHIQTDTTKSKHIHVDKVSDNVDSIRSNRDTKNDNPKENTQDMKIHYLMKYISEQELQCKVCQVSIENNSKLVDSHIRSEKHAIEYIKYLTKNNVSGIGSGRLFCDLCKINIGESCEILHTKTDLHKGKIKSKKRKVSESNAKIDNETKLPVYYCKFCQTYVPNNNHTILYHKNSLKHTRNVELQSVT